MAQKAGLEIRADLKLLRKEMQNAVAEFKAFNEKAIKAASGVKTLEDSTKKAGQSLGFFNSSWGRLVTSITGGFIGAGAITRITSFFQSWGRSIIQATSSLTELRSKAQVVFGDTFPKMEAATRRIAQEVGRSSSSVLQFATDLGSLIKSFGITGPLLDDMSARLAQLAIDMASFHNTSDEDAFAALRSGISGETEPLKRFGIVLTDTNLQLFAMEKGLKNKVSAMNQAQKTALRYEFIMSRTADSQGDAARTAETFANQTRRLKGEITELNEEAGKLATPLLAEGIGRLAKVFQNVRLLVRALTSDIASLIATMRNIPGIGSVGSLISNSAKSLFGSTVFGQMKGATNELFSKAGQRIAEDRKLDDAAALQERMDALAGFDKLGGGLSTDSAGGAKKAAEEREKAEKDIIEALGQQAKLMTDKISQEREELMLRKELGIITRAEERRLEMINRRLVFKNDQIDEATKAWQDQVSELKRVEEAIARINDKIAEEQDSLRETLGEIEKDTRRSKEDKAANLIRERNDLEGKVIRREGLSDKERERLAEIEQTLASAGSAVTAEGDRIAGLNEFQLIDFESERKRKDAEEKSSARMRDLQEELDAENRKLQLVKQAEEEKKQAVLQSLAERLAVTTANYKAEEDATRAHVDAMIAEFNRLNAAKNSPASAFATGGPVFGPGGPTDDSIPAWLSNGEYVINAAATRMYRPILDRINSRAFPIPRFAQGGPVSHSDSHDQTITVHQHNHGEAAKYAPDPRRIRWTLRKYA